MTNDLFKNASGIGFTALLYIRAGVKGANQAESVLQVANARCPKPPFKGSLVVTEEEKCIFFMLLGYNPCKQFAPNLKCHTYWPPDLFFFFSHSDCDNYSL